jgi:hypothetical protein
VNWPIWIIIGGFLVVIGTVILGYGWHKMPLKPDYQFSLVLAVGGVVLGFALGVLSSEYYYARSQRASRNLAYLIMSRPVPFVRKLPVIINDGGNIQLMITSGRYLPAINLCPFSFFITQDGSINLHGEIRDAEGNIVAEGIGDSIRVIQPNKYDVNSDTKAIEVVDTNQQPVFQLMVISYEDFIKKNSQLPSMSKQQTEKMLKEMKVEEIIQLSYITPQGKSWYVSFPHGTILGSNLEEDERLLIPRLFCYPGYSHPGKRNDQFGMEQTEE